LTGDLSGLSTNKTLLKPNSRQRIKNVAKADF